MVQEPTTSWTSMEAVWPLVMFRLGSDRSLGSAFMGLGLSNSKPEPSWWASAGPGSASA